MTWVCDLRGLAALRLGETAAKRGHRYLTVFIDMDRKDKPVIFVTPGKGKECLKTFRRFPRSHGGEPTRVAEVVCDMSPAVLAAVGKTLPNPAITVDWFHVVQLFTTGRPWRRSCPAHRCRAASRDRTRRGGEGEVCRASGKDRAYNPTLQA